MVGGFIAVGATDRIFQLSMCEVGPPKKKHIYEDVKIYGRTELFSVSLSKTKKFFVKRTLKKFQKSKLNNRRTHFPLFSTLEVRLLAYIDSCLEKKVFHSQQKLLVLFPTFN